jgi:hypothetical protein
VPLDAYLSAAVHAINSIAGPEGLIPALLVFGRIPRLPPPDTIPLLNQKRRFKMMQATKEEYISIVAKLRVRHGLNTQLPEASDHSYTPGDSVYVYRERLKHWAGPQVVASVDGKHVSVHLGEAAGPRHFAIWH